jgi:hypothetical protein
MENYEDIQQVDFSWVLPDEGFEWMEKPWKILDSEGKKTSEKPPVLKYIGVRQPGYKDEVTTLRWTHPLEESPTVFHEFADLEPTRDEILAFANKYGLPCMNLVVNEKKGDSPLYTCSLGTWVREVNYMKDLRQLWTNTQVASGETNASGAVIKANAIKELEFQTKLEDGHLPSRYVTGIDELLLEAIEHGGLEHYDVIRLAKVLLITCVNWKLKGKVFQQLSFGHDGSIVPRLIPANLLSAMWLQFSLWIAEQSSYKRCRVCGLWADTTGLRSDWKEHTECGSRRRAKESYERRKQVLATQSKKGR